ncbi:hypothetical protein QWY82_11340 [Simiduia curdlanivorans]|uniref:Uncharacterized protein n=1 Tax=Simiduia curdlanivorans TaxID=1492769 RepID=A0ABV8V8N0_9GAMM|nr:hypothetical protein [Simiduia curdlanivorans]MDN3639399.1 hypothetical protein [Simiduia curdlanivorans]
MNMKYSFVEKADQNTIKVSISDDELMKKLIASGFRASGGNHLQIETSGDKDKAKIFNLLRNMGIYFSDGKEWCPSEVFEHLRDLGILEGKFKRISWRGNSDVNIQEI